MHINCYNYSGCVMCLTKLGLTNRQFFVWFEISEAAPWHTRLYARLHPLGSRVRVSVTPCRFRGGQNGVRVGFSRGFSRFPLPQISFHHFSTLILFISFHLISSTPVMVCQTWSAGILAIHNVGTSSHLIPLPGPVSDTIWRGFFFFKSQTRKWTRLRKHCSCGRDFE